jgi:starch-binding outer membrane protein, SusD/RagB family
MKNLKILVLLGFLAVTSCEEFITEEPFLIITDDTAIIDEASAQSALLGAYSALQSANAYGNLAITTPGVLSDELNHTGSFPTVKEMQDNEVLPNNVTQQGYWQAYYAGILRTNLILEKLENIDISTNTKSLIIGQAKFLRALMHFDLMKLYGAIPLVTSSSLSSNSNIGRTPVVDIYNFLVTELTESATLLDNVDYGDAGRDAEDRTRAGEWAVKALLARVQLYKGDKAAAGTLANDVITNGGYTLPVTYSTVFNGNSSETIFEIFSSVNDQNGLAFQVRVAGRYEYGPSAEIIAAFEPGDLRTSIISTVNAGKPEVAKYKDVATGTDKTIVSRLAEMYLIRAEANIGNATADADLNIVRTRAGLANKTGVSLNDILQERFVELCFEGHRWNDLIRTQTVNQVMSVINPLTWDETDVLLPIPQREIDNNPALKGQQNPGY